MNRKQSIFTTGIFLFLLLAMNETCVAQVKQKESLGQLWTGYFNQTRFSKRWGLWFDVQARTREDVFTGLSSVFIRPGITYYLGDATKLTAGYGYFRNYPVNTTTTVVQPEHRPWQQVQWHTKYAKMRTMQYLRLEERYRRKIANDSTLGSGYNFNFRVRYNFLLQVPLNGPDIKKGDLSLILNDEVHVNFGKQVVYNYFDQNRAFAGFAYHLNPADNIQFGYLNVFLQQPAGNRYRTLHAVRVAFLHNIDARAKK